jgi:hypothetical protein
MHDLSIMNDRRAAARTEALALRAACPPAPPAEQPELTYTITVTCPRCGGTLDHVTGSPYRPPVGLEHRAVAACARCRDRFVITIGISGQRQYGKRLASANELAEQHARTLEGARR